MRFGASTANWDWTWKTKPNLLPRPPSERLGNKINFMVAWEAEAYQLDRLIFVGNAWNYVPHVQHDWSSSLTNSILCLWRSHLLKLRRGDEGYEGVILKCKLELATLNTSTKLRRNVLAFSEKKKLQIWPLHILRSESDTEMYQNINKGHAVRVF